MADQQSEITFIDNPHAPEVHSTGHAGLWLHMGNVHVTLGAGRVNHDPSAGSGPGPMNHVVIGRLVMPAPAAKVMAEHILAMLANPGGVIQTPPPTSLH